MTFAQKNKDEKVKKNLKNVTKTNLRMIIIIIIIMIITTVIEKEKP